MAAIKGFRHYAPNGVFFYEIPLMHLDAADIEQIKKSGVKYEYVDLIKCGCGRFFGTDLNSSMCLRCESIQDDAKADYEQDCLETAEYEF